MQDIRPCLDDSSRPRHQPHPAILLHEGWVAARNREPMDATQPEAWQEGWRLWWQVQAQGYAHRPTVWPPI